MLYYSCPKGQNKIERLVHDMKFTKEQVAKWNSKMGQGFRTDLNRLAMWGEKQPHLMTKVNETTILELTLYYQDEYKTVTSEYGCTYNRPTGKHIPVINVRKWIDEGTGMLHGYGIGKTFEVGEACEKKMFSTLQKLTHTIDVNKYLGLAMLEPGSNDEAKPIIG